MKYGKETEEGMSDEVTAPPEDGMENDIRAAYDCLPDIAKRRKTSRIVRILGLLTYVLLIVLGLYSAFSTLRGNVVDRAPELAQNLQEDLAAMIPTIEMNARAKAKELIPKMQVEMQRAQKKAQKNLEHELTGKNGAGAQMKANLSKKLDEKIEQRHESIREAHRNRLVAAFPEKLGCKEGTDTQEVCDARKERTDLILSLMMQSQQRWAQKELGSTYAGHLKEFEKISETMSLYTTTPEGKKEPASGTPSDMLTLWLEFAGESMAGSNDLFEEPESEK